MLHKAASSTLDLYTTSSLLLNVFYVATACSDNLRAQVEAWNGFEVDGNALFWPLATAEVIAVRLLAGLFSSAESALIDQVWKLLLHELVDLGHGLFEAILGGARDVEVEWWVLLVGQYLVQ